MLLLCHGFIISILSLFGAENYGMYFTSGCVSGIENGLQEFCVDHM